MGDASKNFNRSEFACKCGCNLNIIDDRVIDMCQAIRNGIGLPITISSGTRCAKHNNKVGGVANSYHTQGLAADLHCKIGSEKLYQMIVGMYKLGLLPDLQYCKRYIKKDFVHIDCGKVRKNRFVEGN